MKKENWGKLAFTSVMGLFLSSTFVFLAALPIRYTRLHFGRWVFLITTLIGSCALFAFKQWQWAIVYFCLSLLIGSYRELEEKKLSIFMSALISIGTTTGLFFATLFSIARMQKIQVSQLLNNHLEPMLVQLRGLPQMREGVDINSIVAYLPSGMIITLMIVTFISLTFHNDPFTRKKGIESLKKFTLPDWGIWVFIGSLCGAFALNAHGTYSFIFMNIFAVTLAAYFFQGFAVFSCLLDRFKIFGFWRLLAYFLVFFQMFLFVCGLGILDYWFDFRSQLKVKNKRIGI